MVEKTKLLLRSWWQELTQRERVLLQLGCVMISLFLSYEFFWQNIEQRNRIKISAIDLDLTQWQWMKRTVAHIHHNNQLPLRGQRKKISADNLLPITQQLIRQSRFIKLPSISQVGEDQVQVVFSSVAFHQFITWLINFSNYYTIKVMSTQLTATNKAGIIQAEIILSV